MKSIFTFLFIIGYIFLFGQSEIDWTRNFGGTGDEIANDIIQTQDGGYLVVGTTTSSDADVSINKGGNDIWLIKISPCGELEWERTYGGSGDDFGISVIEVADGNLYIGGHTDSNDGDIEFPLGEFDNIIIKTDEDGNMIWSRNFGDSFNNRLRAMAINSNNELTTISENGVFTGQSFQNITSHLITFDNNITQTLDVGPFPARTGYASFFSGNIFLTDSDETISFFSNFYRQSLNINAQDSYFFKNGSQLSFFHSESFQRNANAADYRDGLQNHKGELIFVGTSFPSQISQILSLDVNTGDSIALDTFEAFGIHNIVQDSFNEYYFLGFNEQSGNDLSLYNYDKNLEFRERCDLGVNGNVGLQEMITTLDGGLAICGYNDSIGGTVLNNFGGQDFWVVKLNTGEPPLALDVEIEPVCSENDGYININNVVGGIPPFQYLWSTGDTTQVVGDLSSGIYTVTIQDSNGRSIIESYEIIRKLTAPSVEIKADCGISSGLIQIVNGLQNLPTPLIYQWSNGTTDSILANVPFGNYTLNFKDGDGCTFTESYNIDFEPITFTNITTHGDCGNSSGFIQLEVSENAISPFSYDWNIDTLNGQQINGLNTGEYSVIITDSIGCNIIDTFQIEGLDLEFEKVETSFCIENEAIINISAPVEAIPPFQYIWEHGASGNLLDSLSSGSYLVEFIDSLGCTVKDSIRLEAPELIFVDSMLISPSCRGGGEGSAELFVTGGTPPYQYLINNRETALDDLSSGQFTVTILDSFSCSTQIELEIPDNDFSVNISSTPAIGNNQDGTATAEAINGFSPFTYQWNTQPIQTTQTAIGLASDWYSCKVTDSTGCSGIFIGFVDQTSNVNELDASTLQIYPNPSSGEVHFDINQRQHTDWNLTITVTAGKLMQTEKGKGSKSMIINDLSAGVYLTKLSFGEGFITKKLVIQP